MTEHSANDASAVKEAQLRERYQRSLEAFVLRARRVEAHSLAQDKDALLELARVTFHFEMQSDGRRFLTMKLPPEEQLESLAARVRPMILKNDPVFGVTAMTALGYLMNGAPADFVELVRGQRKAWLAIDDSSRKIRGYEVQVANLQTGESGKLSDNVLAFAWIYGDTVHASEQPLTETKLFGVQGRYEAAVHLVAHLAVQTIKSLNLIRAAHTQGYLALDERVFSEPVLVTETEIRREIRLYRAPVGTPAPASADEELGADWQEVTTPEDIAEI